MNLTTGDALFVFDEDLTIVSWNAGAEKLTGLAVEDAVGRPCWDVLGGVDERGALVCHAGCSNARLAREGWPVRCRDLTIRTAAGHRRVAVSTVALDTEPRRIVHLMREARTPSRVEEAEPTGLSGRQLEVLQLLADGVTAAAIAERLRIAVPTVRNHIQAILLELGVHSQLEAVAVATRRGLLGR